MNLKLQVIKRLNLSRILWSSLDNGLYCFNFHRIGNWKEASFDPCVYSCDAENFRKHLLFLQANFRIISLEELSEIIKNKQVVTEKLALITFDDGYSDNYHVAYPILKSLNLTATFFITTSLIGANTVPWWDEIAWHVKHCAGQSIQLNDWVKPIVINRKVSREDIRKVLQKIKNKPEKISEQLFELKTIASTKINNNLQKNLFMSWDQVNEMARNNMSFGAHSHTHRVFSSLSMSEVEFEVAESKRLIERNLCKPVKSLSYPIGHANTYHHSMFDIIEKKGYEFAFSFRGVVNHQPSKNRFELGRFSIDQPFSDRILKEMILSA